MTRDMLAMGRPRPQIAEVAGPYVRVTLLGGEPDPEMVRFVSDIVPQELAGSVEVLLSTSWRTSWRAGAGSAGRDRAGPS